ncbi:MAG: DNA-directed RNA polymerase subunit D [Candidatus Micrarchaeota archaeon]
MVEVKKLEEKNNRLSLIVSDADIALMNSLRRTIMNSVPVFAAEKIILYENSSVMPDEMLSHRLGMIPISVSQKQTKKGDEVNLALDKEGPCTVYASDIVSKDAGVTVLDESVPIIKLAKGQKVKLEIHAVAGVGKTHSKFQPALVTYKQIPIVDFSNVKNPEAVAKVFPHGTVEIKAKKLFVADAMRHMISHEAADRFPGEIKMDYDDKKFVLSIESYQQKKNDEIILEGIKALREKTDEFKAALKDL